MREKLCKKCGTKKPETDFSKQTRRGCGLQSKCKKCDAEYRINNMVSVSAAKARWAAANPEKSKQIKKNYFENNKTESLARIAAWKRAHPGWRAKDNLRRRSAAAVVPWANEFFIREVYDLARLRTKVCGFKWHVDHIVPLRSKLVCGLHVENNLQVIPAAQNQSKGNRTWPDSWQVAA